MSLCGLGVNNCTCGVASNTCSHGVEVSSICLSCSLEKKVEMLERKCEIHWEHINNISDYVLGSSRRIDKLQKQIATWEQEFYFLKDKLRNDGNKPHKCPVCDGDGGVKHPLNGLMLPTICLSCEGKGIIWD